MTRIVGVKGLLLLPLLLLAVALVVQGATLSRTLSATATQDQDVELTVAFVGTDVECQATVQVTVRARKHVIFEDANGNGRLDEGEPIEYEAVGPRTARARVNALSCTLQQP